MSPELSERDPQSCPGAGLPGQPRRPRAAAAQQLHRSARPRPDNPFFASRAEHSRVAEAARIDLLIASAGDSVESESRTITNFLGRQMDALIAIPSDEVDSQPNLERAIAQVLTVQLDRKVLDTGAYYVGCDNARGMELIAEHIPRDVDTDHRPPVFVGAEPRSSSTHERLDGFRRQFPNAPVLLGTFDARWGLDAADQILARGTTHGTLVAAADIIALGLLSRLQSLGHRVPEDFRAIGFDGVGVTPLAHPELTTVRQPVEAMAERILELVAGDEPGDEGQDIRLSPTFVIGPSSPRR